jgi:hypothetical protein
MVNAPPTVLPAPHHRHLLLARHRSGERCTDAADRDDDGTDTCARQIAAALPPLTGKQRDILRARGEASAQFRQRRPARPRHRLARGWHREPH